MSLASNKEALYLLIIEFKNAKIASMLCQSSVKAHPQYLLNLVLK
jgi:hypothetical protein